VTLRKFFLENFAGDLEYHPRRAALYLMLAAPAMCFWLFSPPEAKFSTLPLVFLLGSLTLFDEEHFPSPKIIRGTGPHIFRFR
jgi:hypothetical protein